MDAVLKAQHARGILEGVPDFEPNVDLVTGSLERTKARVIVVPRWWLDEVRARVEQSDWGLIDVGAKLADKVGRVAPWNHGSVSRFLRGERVTDDMMEAFVRLFDLPHPIYYPRDLVEASLFQEVADKREARRDSAHAKSPPRRDRLLPSATPEQGAPVAVERRLPKRGPRALEIDRAIDSFDDKRQGSDVETPLDGNSTRGARVGSRRQKPGRA